MELTNGDGVFIRAMTEEDVEQLCADFVKAARFCQEAGFDGVCLHCGHGWLFHQFLSPRTNQRIDRFGGSLENRSRLSVMVLQALREACGREFILECRVSGSEHVPGGYSLEDICGYCRYLSEYADLIHVSAGCTRTPRAPGRSPPSTSPTAATRTWPQPSGRWWISRWRWWGASTRRSRQKN